jgi:hypothetical protein
MGFFIDVSEFPQDGYGLFQLLCVGAVYAYILCVASGWISDGSELLLLIPQVAGIVGSIVLPILGAVPDGALVLFSGLGENAQDTLNVGVGALAGSTIMLLTVPWVLSIIGGRVDLIDGKLNYFARPKLTTHPDGGLFTTGVDVNDVVKNRSYLMLLTALPYLIIQVPGLFYTDLSTSEQAQGEHAYALLGFLVCVFFFCYYLYAEYNASESVEGNQF